MTPFKYTVVLGTKIEFSTTDFNRVETYFDIIKGQAQPEVLVEKLDVFDDCIILKQKDLEGWRVGLERAAAWK